MNDFIQWTNMKVYRRNSNNISSKINEEVVMLNAKKGQYFTLNAVGSHIWDLIETPISMNEICAALMKEFEVDRATCENEVNNFISTCIEMGVIDVEDK